MSSISCISLMVLITTQVHKRKSEFKARSGEALTVARLFDRLALAIPENAIVIVDTGVSLWSAAETQLPRGASFIGTA